MKNLPSIILNAVEKIHPALPELMEGGAEFVPYVSTFLQIQKMNRFERRLKENSDKLERIGQLFSDTSLAHDFIKERVFPIVLADLIEEHEDAKINLILNGFENVFIEEKTNESVVINYLDTLRSLRYMDVKRFLHFSDELFDYPDYPDESDERALTRSIDGKLNSMGLITIHATWGDLEGYDNDVNRERVKLTLYGAKFAKFILSDKTVIE